MSEARTGVSTARPDTEGKLAARVAEQLEEEIVTAGWPVGRVIGSESDLLSRVKVSRAVFREAVRILEHHDVAYMRRGPGGGLVVKAPDSAAAVRASALYLGYRNATWEQVFEARVALELQCVELATRQIDEEGIALLRATLERENEVQQTGLLGTNDLHTALARISGNPAFELFIDVLTRLSVGGRSMTRTARAAGEVSEGHAKIVDAVVSGDVALARHHMRVHLDHIFDSLRAQAEPPGPRLLAHRQIGPDVSEPHDKRGDPLGASDDTTGRPGRDSAAIFRDPFT
ncbi:hypothetical protein GCM10010472_01600 [Pseudonocardia halophobica]|uniref:HTH gntR-type domain-containing protein n=1 Tax=Pseudonocardia halophobica TaxID=29401 RepID=A0A9W6L0E8_9PSEU|nr:FCD domain-containing protein [Pseudonocardia halophobica]GLL10500.1 hypothetical protein GCM10017577_16400 [Pseudonocardia halophobica]